MIISQIDKGYIRVQNGDMVLSVDPTNNRAKSDVILRTSSSTDEPVVGEDEISSAGEYEIKGIDVTGYQLASASSPSEIKTIFLVRWDGVSFVFLGDISELSDSTVLEAISGADILFIPAGGKGIADDAAAKLVRQVEPAVVIPTHGEIYDKFAKALGKKPESMEKFVFKKKDLVEKAQLLVILEE